MAALLPTWLLATILLCAPFTLFAQNGKLLSLKSYQIADSIRQQRLQRSPSFQSVFDSTQVQQVMYESDGLKIAGFIVKPVAEGRYPCIIFCRGGIADFGMLDGWSCMLLSEIASHGYIVVASQYRGSPGSEGNDEIGGADVDDVLNCVPLLSHIPGGDTGRIGLWGVSRGGLMVYQALTQLNNIKAAFVNSGVASQYDGFKREDSVDMEKLAMEHIPGYTAHREEELKKRSAIYWPEKICRATPLLIMQGSSDWRVLASGPLHLVNALYALKQPLRFVLFEGGEHGLRAFPEKNRWVWDWFDKYLKQGSPLPDMALHGD